MDTIPNYRKRISDILLQLQRFYGDNLQREGFGNTSFGLNLLSDTQVNIITLRACKGKSAYPYSSGIPAIRTEVNQYYLKNPDAKKSEHSLIILPSFNSDPNNPGGGPFNGSGIDCFTLDYPEMDVNKSAISFFR